MLSLSHFNKAFRFLDVPLPASNLLKSTFAPSCLILLKMFQTLTNGPHLSLSITILKLVKLWSLEERHGAKEDQIGEFEEVGVEWPQ